MTPRSILRNFRTLVAGTALALFVIPSVASADAGNNGAPGPEAAQPHDAGKHQGKRGKHKRGKHKGRKHAKRFPMEGAKFTKHVDKRLSRVGKRVDRMLDKRKMNDTAKAAVRADVAQAATQIRSVASKASADGTVSEQEAQGVRKLARKLRKELAAKHGLKTKTHRKRRKRGKRGKSGKSA